MEARFGIRIVYCGPSRSRELGFNNFNEYYGYTYLLSVKPIFSRKETFTTLYLAQRCKIYVNVDRMNRMSLSYRQSVILLLTLSLRPEYTLLEQNIR